jgi:hypothetical protein
LPPRTSIPAYQPLPGPNRHTSYTRLAQSLVPNAHVSNNNKCGKSVMPRKRNACLEPTMMQVRETYLAPHT